MTEVDTLKSRKIEGGMSCSNIFTTAGSTVSFLLASSERRRKKSVLVTQERKEAKERKANGEVQQKDEWKLEEEVSN